MLIRSISEIESRNNQSVTLIVTDPIYLPQRCTAIWSFTDVVTILQPHWRQNIPYKNSNKLLSTISLWTNEWGQCNAFTLTFNFDHKPKLITLWFHKSKPQYCVHKGGKTLWVMIATSANATKEKIFRKFFLGVALLYKNKSAPRVCISLAHFVSVWQCILHPIEEI